MCTVAEGAMMVFVRCVQPTKCRRGSEGKSDYLLDFKSNIIVGQQVPSGTGHQIYIDRLKKNLGGDDIETLDFDFDRIPELAATAG